ncbi:MAG: hypothetical protein ACYC3B_03690 [Sedimentisphaerales bacterium]
MTGQEIQNDILRKMTPTEKLRLSMRLYYSAWEFKAAWLRQNHLDWSEQQVQTAVKEVFANARS